MVGDTFFMNFTVASSILRQFLRTSTVRPPDEVEFHRMTCRYFLTRMMPETRDASYVRVADKDRVHRQRIPVSKPRLPERGVRRT
jgi:hypothetical protein